MSTEDMKDLETQLRQFTNDLVDQLIREEACDKTLVAQVSQIILPWFEEIQGVKFAAMDSNTLARQIIATLREKDALK